MNRAPLLAALACVALFASLANGDVFRGNGYANNANLLDGVDGADYARESVMATQTCAAGVGASTLALDIVCPAAGALVYVPIDNDDADGCAITVNDDSGLAACRAQLILIESAGGEVTLADVANEVDVISTWYPDAGDTLTLLFLDLSNDRWSETARRFGHTSNETNACDDIGYPFDGPTLTGLAFGLASGADELAICVGGGHRMSMSSTSAEFSFSAGIHPDADARTFGTTSLRWDLSAKQVRGLESIHSNTGDNIIDLVDDDNNVDGALVMGDGATTTFTIAQAASGGASARFLASGGLIIGTKNDAGNAYTACLGDTITNTGSTSHFCDTGIGMTQHSVNGPQTCTCANDSIGADPGAGTCDISADFVNIVNNDPDGCAWTIDDTTASVFGPGFNSRLFVKTNAGGTNTFATVANVFDDGNIALCDTTGVDLDDRLEMVFIDDDGNDYWALVHCAAGVDP